MNGEKLSLDYLLQVADKLKTGRRRQPTRRVYREAWKIFNDFLICMDKLPNNWDDCICMFVAQLIIENHPPPTIQSYVSGVKAILREDGIDIEDNSVALAALIQSSKQVSRTETRMTMPIQKGLQIILGNTETYFLSEMNQLYNLCALFKEL